MKEMILMATMMAARCESDDDIATASSFSYFFSFLFLFFCDARRFVLAFFGVCCSSKNEKR